MNGMLDFVCVGEVDLTGTREKSIQNEKVLPKVGLESTTLKFVALCSSD